MTKPVATPAAKTTTATSPVSTVAKPAAPVAVPTVEAKPATVSTPAPVVAKPTAPTVEPTVVVEPKKIDMNKQSIKDAIAKGKLIIKEGKSKADASMVIFEALKAEEKDVVIAAFVQGATLTPAGAVTYFYNCKRKAKKLAKSA
jgi:hypothetical protein